MKRVFLIVLDSFGIGALPDAASYGDEHSNTLKAIYSSEHFHAPNMKRMGLFNIDGVELGEKEDFPVSAFARLAEASNGKDTTTGHWEIAGIISEKPFPTFPDGFPKHIIEEFENRIGRKTLCNKPYSGTEVIKDYGKEHLKSAKPIVYTSADSVFQIAAHEDIIPLEELYSYCETAREMLQGDFAVGRVIARPFKGIAPDFKRTGGRHDYSLSPTKETVLDALKNDGFDVIGVGKIHDIFAGAGLTESIKTCSNREGMEVTEALLSRDFNGLTFVNLVDFDMLYGHRNDKDGYASALSEFDLWLGGFTERLRDDDLLIITADHGCDPCDESTDHTREYVPLLMYGKGVAPKNYGTIPSFSCISVTISKIFNLDYKTKEKSLL